MILNVNSIFKLADSFLLHAKDDEKNNSNLDIKSFINKLNNLDTFSDRKEYVENNLERISSGSSRIAYWLPEKKYVLKLASNEKGIAQNHAESSITEKSPFVNLVTDSCPDGTWVIAPAVDKITEKEFEESIGISFKKFGEVLKYSLKELSNKKRTKPENYDKLSQLDIIKHLSYIAKKYKLIPGDLARISSFGLKENIPVLIDTGLTREIYDKYYADKKS